MEASVDAKDLRIDRGDATQQEAIRHYKGPCLVLAGPGSGKTFVLTHRILYLIKTYKVPSSSILVLTFSKAAALEMRERFESLYSSTLQFESSDVVFGTFHSVFFRILQLSSPVTLSVLLPSEQKKLVKHLVTPLALQLNIDEDSAVSSALSGIALKKTCDESTLSNDSRFEAVLRIFGSEQKFMSLYEKYELYLRDNNKIDFEDMIRKCRDLLTGSPKILGRFQRRFQYILVDEFQDVSPEQYSVLKLLAGEKQNLFVVGDDDQSIYGFRGASPSICKTFLTDYRDAKQIFLSVNYRSSGKIIKAAGKVIACNHIRIPKKIVPFHDAGADIQIFETKLPEEQYRIIYDHLKKMSSDQLSDTAVIFRNHLQGMVFETYLKDKDILIRNTGGYKDENIALVIKTVLAYYQTAVGFNEKKDHEVRRGDIYRIMNFPQRYFLRSMFRNETVRSEDLKILCIEHPELRKTVFSFLVDLGRLYELTPKLSFRYLRIGMGLENALLDGRNVEARKRIKESFDEIEKKAASAENVQEFIETLSKDGVNISRFSNEGLSILTMHASKGLEFETCFLPDLNEGILPGRQSMSLSALEEERRLFYVAMTRAKKKLFLSYTTGTRDNPRRPTRFLRPLGTKGESME